MDTRKSISTAQKASRRMAPQVAREHWAEHTGPRIRAFLSKVCALRGTELESSDYWQRGRSLIEDMASSAERSGSDCEPPPLRLSAEDCACVLQFLGQIEPREPATWFERARGEPCHHTGCHMVLFVLRESVLKIGGAS